MIISGALLVALLMASPGPLDRNGGHVDFVSGRYHLHAGPSFQFRYVDGSGRIWKGNGPRPDENLLSAADDSIWTSSFIPFIVIFSLALVAIGYALRHWMKTLAARIRYRRRIQQTANP
jgi:hypothetical protein